MKNLLPLPPVRSSTELFSKEKRTKKKAPETWLTIPERKQVPKGGAAILARRYEGSQ
ncbi:MAG: hypothetical protein V4594_12070 [Bacteroidota bacterium]